LVEPGTLERANAWLAQDGHAPALRRLVTEARDDLARALNARARSTGYLAVTPASGTRNQT
ncbi:MAG: hypothetical protein ACRDVE_06600, partial [Actinocrinis sp.]